MNGPLRRNLKFLALSLTLTVSLNSLAQEFLPDEPQNESDIAPQESQIPGHPMPSPLKPLENFSTPSLTSKDKAFILPLYDHLDPNHLIPENLLEKAVLYYHANLNSLNNKAYLSVIDFSKSSTKKRFFVVNMRSGEVWALHTAHGKGSDANHDGYAEKFSNEHGSNASSLGFYRTAETYSGKYGFSLRLDGLSSTNSNARSRAVVIHGSSYVLDKDVKQGRSWGCPAISWTNKDQLIGLIKNGSLIYAGLSGASFDSP